MMYTLSELGADLDVPARLLREWLTRGLPHQRDGRGHIWIDGRCFTEWIKIESQAKVSKSLSDDEAYCLRCRQPAKLINPTSTQRGKQILWQGVCPNCGNLIYRGGRCG